LSSQLGFLVILANEERTHNSFELIRNIIYWSSVKCKRVIRNILALKIYGMVNGVDVGMALLTILQMIITQFDLLEIPIMIYTNSFLLYECLIKLGITQEKRLMIDIMALR
jgi:hypothetical protein